MNATSVALHPDEQNKQRRNLLFGTLFLGMFLVSLIMGELSFDAVSLLLFVFTFSLYHGTAQNGRYCGYGVAEKVNRISNMVVIPPYRMTWRGYVVEPLAWAWTKSFWSLIAFAFVACLLFFQPNQPHHAQELLRDVIPYVGIYLTSRTVALLCEILIWMRVDRHYYWYLSEDELRKILTQRERSLKAIEVIVERARRAGVFGSQER